MLFAEPQASEMALARVECRCRQVFRRIKMAQERSVEARDVDGAASEGWVRIWGESVYLCGAFSWGRSAPTESSPPGRAGVSTMGPTIPWRGVLNSSLSGLSTKRSRVNVNAQLRVPDFE